MHLCLADEQPITTAMPIEEPMPRIRAEPAGRLVQLLMLHSAEGDRVSGTKNSPCRSRR